MNSTDKPTDISATAERTPLRTGRDGETVCDRVADIDGGTTPDGPLTDGEMKTVTERYRARLLEDPPRSASTVSEWLEALTEGGRWPDIDYDDRSRTDWEPHEALDRIDQIARAYHTDSHPTSGDPALREAAVNALGHWLARDPESDNWWWNIIAVPGKIADIVVLVEDWLTDSQRTDALAVVDRTDPDGTGANLLWTAKIAFLHGCLVGDASVAMSAVREAASEVHLTTGDGVQPDDSFHQHGPRLQQYHYGSAFVSSSVEFADLVSDTGAAVPPATLDLLARTLLDGHRWMQRGGYASPSTLDRAVSRKGALRQNMADTCQTLAALVDDRSDALREFAAHLAAGAPADGAPVTGHRHYWRSDFAVHHRDAFFASLKYVSGETRATEDINEENLRGGHLTDGALFVTRRGDEYEGVFPLWDWSHVPGVTVPERTGAPEPGESSFAGSLSDGTYGVTGFDVSGASNVTARKAWFFGDRSVTCLGAGISAPTERDGGETESTPVTTTLAQRRLVGPVHRGTGDGVRSVENGTVLADRSLDWLHHDGIGYVFPERTAATVSTRVQEGSWHDINHQYDDDTTRLPVFAAWTDHGSAPDGETYAYVLRPGVEADEMSAIATDQRTRVLTNEPTVQGVRTSDAGVVGAVFYESGTIDPETGPAVAVDEPCLFQLRERADGTVATVADPTGTCSSVTVTVGDESWQVPLADCAQGRKAGTTVSLGEVQVVLE